MRAKELRDMEDRELTKQVAVLRQDLFGLPSGHTSGPGLTLPFGVRARVVTAGGPALIIQEAAVA